MKWCEDQQGVDYVLAIQTFASNQLRLWLSSMAYVLVQAFRYSLFDQNISSQSDSRNNSSNIAEVGGESDWSAYDAF